MTTTASSLEKLISHFKDHTQFPIEINEIKDWIVNEGYQEEINFIPFENDNSILKGFIRMYERQTGVYSDSNRVSDIHYSKNMSECWQRTVCCKEMVHILDSVESRTSTQKEIQDLTFNLCSQFDGYSNKAVLADKAALLPALRILAPIAKIEQLREAYQEKTKNDYDIAAFFRIPKFYIPIMMSENYKNLISCIDNNS